MDASARLTPEQRAGMLRVNKARTYDDRKINQKMIKSPRKNVKQRIKKQAMVADTRDELSRQYFNGKNIEISRLRSDIILHAGIADKEILPSLVGALDGSIIRVDIRKNRVDFESRHALYDRPIRYMLDKEGILHAVEFYLAPQAPEGTGTRMMTTTLLTAQALGIPEVQLKAAGRPDNGYYTWPRLGFDGTLPDKMQGAARRAGFYNSHTVLDIMGQPDGRAWWLENGIRLEMKFILDGDSRSMKTLLNYLAEKGVRL